MGSDAERIEALEAQLRASLTIIRRLVGGYSNSPRDAFLEDCKADPAAARWVDEWFPRKKEFWEG